MLVDDVIMANKNAHLWNDIDITLKAKLVENKNKSETNKEKEQMTGDDWNAKKVVTIRCNTHSKN